MLQIQNYVVFQSIRSVGIIANSVDADKKVYAKSYGTLTDIQVAAVR